MKISRRPATVIGTKAATTPLTCKTGWEGAAIRMTVSQETWAKPKHFTSFLEGGKELQK